MGQEKNEYRFWWKNLKGGDFLDDLGIYRRIILKHILNK